MMFHHRLSQMIIGFSVLTLAVLLSVPAFAHCDSMDGPVVADAQRALEEKDVNPILKWVRSEDEDQIQKVFEMTLAVRVESSVARNVADRYFFETLVRIHRAGEGEAFTGLKPAGSAEPGIVAADRALADGNIDQLANKLAESVKDAIKQRFAQAKAKRLLVDKSVAQGREYVEAYVQLTHFVEAADHLVSNGASHKHLENNQE